MASINTASVNLRPICIETLNNVLIMCLLTDTYSEISKNLTSDYKNLNWDIDSFSEIINFIV